MLSRRLVGIAPLANDGHCRALLGCMRMHECLSHATAIESVLDYTYGDTCTEEEGQREGQEEEREKKGGGADFIKQVSQKRENRNNRSKTSSGTCHYLTCFV